MWAGGSVFENAQQSTPGDKGASGSEAAIPLFTAVEAKCRVSRSLDQHRPMADVTAEARARGSSRGVTQALGASYRTVHLLGQLRQHRLRDIVRSPNLEGSSHRSKAIIGPDNQHRTTSEGVALQPRLKGIEQARAFTSQIDDQGVGRRRVEVGRLSERYQRSAHHALSSQDRDAGRGEVDVWGLKHEHAVAKLRVDP